MQPKFSKEKIGNILHSLREASELSQNDVASLVGTTQQTIARWESGKNQPDIDTFFRLCDIYQTDISLAFGLRESSAAADEKLVDNRPASDNSDFTQQEQELVAAYRKADTKARAIVDLALSEYKKTTNSKERAV